MLFLYIISGLLSIATVLLIVFNVHNAIDAWKDYRRYDDRTFIGFSIGFTILAMLSLGVLVFFVTSLFIA